MIQACPICLIERDGMIPQKIVPIQESITDYSHLESYPSLGEVLLLHKAIDRYNIDKATPVLAISPVERTYCGGKAIFHLWLAKNRKPRMFGYFGWGIYLSVNEDGILETAIPA